MSPSWLRIALVVSGVALCAAAGQARQSTAPAGPTGKGVIAGTVVDAVTNQPIPEATVNVSADGNRTYATTDDQGRFAVRDLPAGRLFLSSIRTGYQTGYYGIRSLFAQSQSFDLADGETATGVVIRMWKNAVVTGTVTDAGGDPLVAATVMVARVEVLGGRTTIGTGRRVGTDDRGRYRLIDVAPGNYVVALVSPLNQTPGRRTYSSLSYPTVFYPGIAAPTEVSFLTVGAGEERSGIDFRVTTSVRWFSVSGVVTGRTGERPRPVELELRPSDPGRIPMDLDVRRVATDTEGRFTFPNVPPGAYVIEGTDIPIGAQPAGTSAVRFQQMGNGFSLDVGPGSSLPVAPLPVAPVLWASTPVVVEDRSIDDVAVVLRPGARISGRVVFEGGAKPPSEATLAATPVLPMSEDGQPLGSIPVSGLRPDGGFHTIGLPPGRYRLLVWITADPRWSIASIEVDGRNIGAAPLVLGATDLTNVVVTLTDRPTRLSGTVRREDGTPDPDATIYVFSTDRQLWRDTAVSSGTSREVRPSRRGLYETTMLPGEYFVAAVEASAREDWNHADVLPLLAATARTVTMGRGQTAALDLTVPKGK